MDMTKKDSLHLTEGILRLMDLRWTSHPFVGFNELFWHIFSLCQSAETLINNVQNAFPPLTVSLASPSSALT